MEKDVYKRQTTVRDLAVAGEYLLVAKTQGTDFEKNNKYIIVYSGTVSNAEGKFGATTVYFPVEYEGVVSLPGDQFMVTETEGIVGHSKIGDSSYWTDGYVDGAEMYKAIISANRDKYTYEVSEGLKLSLIHISGTSSKRLYQGLFRSPGIKRSLLGMPVLPA